MSEPKVIQLDSTNSINILNQYIEHAQKNGTFNLQEADILKRCRDVLLNNLSDGEITVASAKTLFIQAVHKGQAKGCYSLDDASILHKVCIYVNSNLNEALKPQPQAQPQDNYTSSNDDLSELSEPIPLRNPRVI
jgi:hypothetical protein